MSEDLKTKYRDMLIDLEQKTMASYDKTLITLSTGALGLSIVFINEILPKEFDFICCLIFAWVMWGLSLSLILISFYFSSLAFRKSIQQIDNDVIDKEVPGGVFTRVCNILTPISGSLFIIGAFFFLIFVIKNIGG